MRSLFDAAKMLLYDLLSTFLFLGVVLATHNVALAIGTGMAAGVAQMAWRLWRKQPVDLMQWMSLGLVVVAGGASLITNDPRFVLVKPSLIYLVVGAVMLRRGWMNRYLPPTAQQVVGDLGLVFGYVWAGLMFVSAGVNLYAGLNMAPVRWAAFMSTYGLATKLGLFLVQYAVMRVVGGRRRRRMEAAAGPQGASPPDGASIVA